MYRAYLLFVALLWLDAVSPELASVRATVVAQVQEVSVRVESVRIAGVVGPSYSGALAQSAPGR
ncbi:MAG: hypothetical protein HYV07_33050 [Deltaproteobacteria bacterium]|nr:hypothetical protein [Deltaproteobacteria bacterium]